MSNRNLEVEAGTGKGKAAEGISGAQDKILRNGFFIGFSAKKYMSNQYILAGYGFPVPARHGREGEGEGQSKKTGSSPPALSSIVPLEEREQAGL
jgi:hypothetical protein